MKALTIALVELKRLFRDRSNIFWVLIAPLLFVFVLGLLFGGGQPLRLGLVEHGEASGPVAQRLTDALEADERVEVTRFDQTGQLRTDVERGMVHAGLVMPTELDAKLRDGDQVTLEYLARPNDSYSADLEVLVRAVVSQQATIVGAAQFGAAEGAGSYEENLRLAEAVEVSGVEVAARTAGESAFPDEIGQFAPIAPSMLLLYVFLTSLTAALALIQARRLRVITRMYATPTSAATIVTGEALGRFAIALTQALIVLVGSALLFGVDWGDPLGAIALVVLFCLTGSGAAMLLGSLFRNEGPALGASLGLGLGLAALGGTMVPLEILSDTAQRIAHLTPHAWGYEGFSELVRHGGGIGDILPQLGALTGFATVLFVLGVWRLRHVISE